MISLGRRDGRKGLGFGGGGEMEETELEEGEACYYPDDDTSIDPDVALSYLDEKVQDVLGHFQKDFEGGVSAENLGAKFGGYGSFLPTYQRSPTVLSHPRTPQNVQNNGTPRSPNNFPLEGSRQNSTVPSSATLSLRLGPASTSGTMLPILRAPSADNSSKRDVYLSSVRSTEEFTPKHEPVSKSTNLADQKTLKVRIKVGPDNTSAKKNAEIYSGLGLDISPSSSPEDSPIESGGLSPEFRDTLDESPTSILQITTSFPVPGAFLLSPLPDSLLRLVEKEKLLRDSRFGPARKGSQESAAMLVDESPTVRGGGKVFGEKKKKSMEKSVRSIEVKNGNSKDVGNEISALLTKEIDIETPEGRELVSNALKLPLLSNSTCSNGDTAKVTVRASDVSREGNKGVAKEKLFSSDFAKEEALESIANQDVNRVEKRNSKTSLADKVYEDRKASSYKNIQFDWKDGRSKDDKSNDPFKAEFDWSKERKDLNGGPIDPPKQKVGQKTTSHEQDGVKMLHWKEQPLSGGKKKSKGSHSNSNPASELPKESLRVSAGTKDKKKSAGDYPTKNKLDDSRLPNESGKSRESHRHLFGDIKMEQEENLLEMPSKDRPKDSKLEVVEKEAHSFADKSKERSHGKKIDNPLTSEAYPKVAPSVAPPITANGPISDTVPGTVAPVVIEENWVCCDECQKWRLLPFGTNPDSLPKKWLCSMLNWLPGMNRCNVSEEETTKAMNALYQVSVPESQSNLRSQPDGTAPGVTLDDVRHLDQMHQDHSLHAVPSGGKKKQGSKQTSNSANHTGPVHISNSTKKNQQASVKSRSLNDVNMSPFESNPANKAGFQHLSKSSDSVVEIHGHKQKEKHKVVLDRGDAKHSKTKSKREADQDGFIASKKIRTEDWNYTDEHWNSDHGGITGKVGPSPSNGLPARATGKDMQKYGEYSYSKDSKCDAKENLAASVKKMKDQVQVSLDGGALDMGKCDKMDIAVKKRKVKEWQESQIFPPETLPNTGHYLQDNRVSVKEETSESKIKKEKKARVSKSVEKESSTSKGDGRTNKKGRVSQVLISGSRDPVADGTEEVSRVCLEKDQQLGQYQGGNTVSQRSLDGIESLKRDLGYGQPSMAATSSSSKVSSSRKSKANFQEVKGSPVESVSSSPLRLYHPDKVTSAKRNLLGKDDATNVGLSGMGSPKRCSDGEGDGGSDRSGTVRKEKASSVVHRRSLESSVLDYQDRYANHTSGSNAKEQTEPSPYEFENPNLVNGGVDTLDKHNQYPGELRGKEHVHDEGRVNDNRFRSNGCLLRKSGKGSSSRSKDKQRSSKSDFDKGKIKTNSFSEQEELYPSKSSRYEVEIESHDRSPYHEESRKKYSFQEKCDVKSDKDEKNYLGKKDPAGKWSSEARKENQLKFGGHDGSDVKLGATCSKDGKSNPQQNLLQGREDDRSLNRFLSDRTDRLETASGRGKSQLFPHFGDRQETHTRCPRPIPGTHKGSGSDVMPVDASGGVGGDASKVPKQPRKPDKQNGAHHNSLRHSTPNRPVVGDLDAPSPVRKDSSSQAAANALKEATDLKHSADRLKSSGSDLDRTWLYFQAALKFLHGASLLEPCNSESAKHGEITQSMQVYSDNARQSMQVYSDTARLCEFIAHEYERCKEMAAAALAYKCMEVAYMKVIYSKHSSAIKDRHELQTALQMVPPGESPSSSASDVDNLNNQGTLDKVALVKAVSSPHIAGNHVIVARNRPNYARLLNYVQDVNFAMDALRKSQNAFAAANVNLEEPRHGEGILSVERVLNFNFHDVHGLLRLVRLAMETISR